jgi:hypothetical protein
VIVVSGCQFSEWMCENAQATLATLMPLVILVFW